PDGLALRRPHQRQRPGQPPRQPPRGGAQAEPDEPASPPAQHLRVQGCDLEQEDGQVGGADPPPGSAHPPRVFRGPGRGRSRVRRSRAGPLRRVRSPALPDPGRDRGADPMSTRTPTPLAGPATLPAAHRTHPPALPWLAPLEPRPIALGPSADHPVLRHALDIGADRFWSSARHGLVVGRKQAAFDTAAFQYALAASPARSPHLRAALVDAGVELDAAVNDYMEQEVLS